MTDLTPAAALRDMADHIDRGPDIPLPPRIYSSLCRERAQDLDTGNEQVLIWSNQRGMWWRPDERGYTTHIDEAGRYALGDARRIVDNSTCHGQLVAYRADPVTGREYREYDEVIVPLPASSDRPEVDVSASG